MKRLGLVFPTFALLATCSVFHQIDRPDGEEESGYGLYVTLPSEELARKHQTTVKELHIGFGTYVRECGTCHAHVLPTDLSDSAWHVTTPKMAWNANISDREQKALLAYLIAAAGDPGQPEKQPSFRKITPQTSR